MSGLDIQTLITITSLLLNVKEVHGWFASRTIQQKATVLWHVYSSMSDVLLATLWWCMRADDSINKPLNAELGHSVGFSKWTTGVYAYLFWSILGLKALTQFPASLATRQQQTAYLTYCYLITVAAHFPFILCVLTEVQWNGWIIAAGLLATAVCYVVYLASELMFRLQAPDPFSATHTELVSTLRFGVEWFYLMIMVLPFSNWQLQLPDYFLLGYAVRVLLWLAYTAVMSKASSTLEEVAWLMFRPVKGGRPGEYEEVGQVEERKGQLPFGGRMTSSGGSGGGSSGGGEEDGSSSSSDDNDEEGSEEDVGEEVEKKEKKRSKRNKPTSTQQKSKRSTTQTPTKAAVDRHTTHDAAHNGSDSGGSSSSSGSSMVDVRGSETVTARVNGETVILIKKAKPPAPGTSSGSGGGSASGGATEGMHALDIADDDSSGGNKSQKKGR